MRERTPAWILDQMTPEQIDDLTALYEYESVPSNADIGFLKNLEDQGVNIDGYIIDDEAIVKYDADTPIDPDPEDVPDWTRCGY